MLCLISAEQLLIRGLEGKKKTTHVPLRVRLAGSLALALAGKVERRQGGVVRVKRWQLMTVNGGRGVGPKGAGGRQRGPHAAAETVGLALPPLVLNGRL